MVFLDVLTCTDKVANLNSTENNALFTLLEIWKLLGPNNTLPHRKLKDWQQKTSQGPSIFHQHQGQQFTQFQYGIKKIELRNTAFCSGIGKQNVKDCRFLGWTVSGVDFKLGPNLDHDRKTFDTTRIGGTVRRGNLSNAVSGLAALQLALQDMRISSPLTEFEEHLDGPKDEGHEWK